MKERKVKSPIGRGTVTKTAVKRAVKKVADMKDTDFNAVIRFTQAATSNLSNAFNHLQDAQKAAKNYRAKDFKEVVRAVNIIMNHVFLMSEEAEDERITNKNR